MRGFTLVEILISVFLIFLLASLFISVGLSFYKVQQLRICSQEILQILRRAQTKAMSTEQDSSFGVYLTNENYVLFKGDSYTLRDSQYDEVFELPQIIRINGLSEVVFLKLEGTPRGNPAYCAGACTPCGELNRGRCRRQDGCWWFFFTCVGTCIPCNNYQNQSECEEQLGCTWYPATRGGDIIITSNGESRTININEMGRLNLQ